MADEFTPSDWDLNGTDNDPINTYVPDFARTFAGVTESSIDYSSPVTGENR